MEIPLNPALGGDELGEADRKSLSLFTLIAPIAFSLLDKICPSIPVLFPVALSLCQENMPNNIIPPSPLPLIMGAVLVLLSSWEEQWLSFASLASRPCGHWPCCDAVALGEGKAPSCLWV